MSDMVCSNRCKIKTQEKFQGITRLLQPDSTQIGIAWQPDASLYRAYAVDSSWNIAHVNDVKRTAMLKEGRRTQDLEARRRLIYDIQRYATAQQYIVYTTANMVTASWAPYVKNYSPNITFDYGSRAAALWLAR